MPKILVIGDVHGRLIWNDIIDKEFNNVDKVIFLGDYVDTHEDISPDQQLSNLEDILNFKEENPDKIILLRGNHDCSELGYSWASCSGFNRNVYKGMQLLEQRFLNDTQWIYIEDKTIFSHAGISRSWLENCNITLEEINNLEPSPIFGFTPTQMSDVYGTSPTQPCTWIRPQTLASWTIEGYDQIVGHTPVATSIVDIHKCVKYGQHIWLCDALHLKQYLILADGDVKICRCEC